MYGLELIILCYLLSTCCVRATDLGFVDTVINKKAVKGRPHPS